MLKETIRVSERNETLTIKNVGLDLALIIRVNSNLTALRKDNASRPRSPRVTLVNPRIIMGRNPIRTSYASIITMARRAI
jgi:hypothetical protein